MKPPSYSSASGGARLNKYYFLIHKSPPAYRQPGSPFYSVLKLFTGLATAALIAWKLIVNNAIKTASNPAPKNIHQLMLILYAKSCSQLCIMYHATGEAIRNAMTTSLIKSFERSATIFVTEAPSTFLTPISFVR